MLSQARLFKQCFPSSFYCKGCCARHTWTGGTEPSSAMAGTAAGNNCSSQEWPQSHHYCKPVRMSVKLQAASCSTLLLCCFKGKLNTTAGLPNTSSKAWRKIFSFSYSCTSLGSMTPLQIITKKKNK